MSTAASWLQKVPEGYFFATNAEVWLKPSATELNKMCVLCGILTQFAWLEFLISAELQECTLFHWNNRVGRLQSLIAFTALDFVVCRASLTPTNMFSTELELNFAEWIMTRYTGKWPFVWCLLSQMCTDWCCVSLLLNCSNDWQYWLII